MGSKLDTKQMEVLSFNIWAGGAGEKWRRRGEQRSAASGGHPSKATTWRGRHHLNLPHHQQGGTPALWSPSTKGTKESAGGAQGRRRREGAVEEIFHFHWKVKVAPT